MAHVAIILDASGDSIEQLNAKLQRAGKPEEAAQALCNFLLGASSGMESCEMQIVVRDTDPSVSTSGTNSTDETYDLK